MLCYLNILGDKWDSDNAFAWVFGWNSQIAFRGIKISKEEVVLDGSEAPVRIDAEALLSTEKLVPSAVLNKVKFFFNFWMLATLIDFLRRVKYLHDLFFLL